MPPSKNRKELDSRLHGNDEGKGEIGRGLGGKDVFREQHQYCPRNWQIIQVTSGLRLRLPALFHRP